MVSLALAACQSPTLKKSPEPPPQGAPSCTAAPFSPGEGLAQSDGENWYYELTTLDQAVRLRIDLLSRWDGPSTPGSYSLDGINYRDCGLCVIAYAECGDDGCQKTLYADEGTVTLDELGTATGQRISGTIKNAVFREVTIASDWSSSPVPGGKTWCVKELPFNQALGTSTDIDLSGETSPEEPSDKCEPAGSGTGLGANIANFSLQNCEGEWVNFHDLGCTEEIGALWLVASADWCGPCHNYADRAQLMAEENRERGLSLIKIIGEDAFGSAPSLQTCRNYANRHNLLHHQTFIDPHWETLWKFVYPYATLDGTVLLPWVALLKRSNGEYRFNNQLSLPTSEWDHITTLLNEEP